MDTKRLITMMLISFAVIFGWQIFVHQVLYPRHPEWRRSGQPPVAATQPAIPTTTPATSPTTQLATTTGPSSAPPATAAIQTAPTIAAAPPAPPAPPPPAPGSQPAVRVVAAATQPTVATLGDDPSSSMIVRISSAGAGLESVTLKDFRAPPDVTRERGGPVTRK